jgi:nicotinamidase-related amidase
MPLLDSAPYPWPYDEAIDPHRLALVIAGAQPAWAERSANAAAVMEQIESVAGVVRAVGGHVVFVRHVSRGRRPCGLPPLASDPGAAVLPIREDGDVTVDAAGVNGFYGSALDDELRHLGADHLVFAGWGAEAAVDSTLRSANDRGYECLVLTDAVAPFDVAVGERALASVTMSGGIFGALATTEMLLASLSELLIQEPT